MSLPPGQASRHLIAKTSWSEDQRRSTAAVVESLASSIPTGGFYLVGLSGAPGCGKSTLAGLLLERLAEYDVDGMVISLDDYYLGTQQRSRLAEHHPLFAQRGVPGTHDWEKLLGDLDHLKRGEIETLLLPRFDKMSDDRMAIPLEVPVRPRVVILEGWVIGAPPQAVRDLEIPVNELEATHDPGGRWRARVNQHLAQYHHDLSRRLDATWFMSVPGWSSVVDWRWQQEQQNAGSERPGFLKSRDEVADFLDRFQRLAIHMLATAEEWADVIIDIDPDHILSIRD